MRKQTTISRRFASMSRIWFIDFEHWRQKNGLEQNRQVLEMVQ